MMKFEIVDSDNEEFFYVKCNKKSLYSSKLNKFSPERTEHGWLFKKEYQIPVLTKIVRFTTPPKKIYIEKNNYSFKFLSFLIFLNIFITFFFHLQKNTENKTLKFIGY